MSIPVIEIHSTGTCALLMLVAGERRIDRIGVLTFSYDCNERATDESFRLSTVLFRLFFFLNQKAVQLF